MKVAILQLRNNKIQLKNLIFFRFKIPMNKKKKISIKIKHPLNQIYKLFLIILMNSQLFKKKQLNQTQLNQLK